MKRKLLALLLALVMVLSLLPAALVPDTAVAETGPIDQTIVEGGTILHCFNWSYKAIIDNLDDIAAAGYTAVQTSPVQPPKDYNAAWDNTKGGWWKFYQPLDFRIAGEGETWLCEGGKTLADLCTEAHKRGIKVIVDVVANHTANKAGGGVLKDGKYNVSEQVAERLQDPDNSKKIYHWNENNIGDSRYEMTQYQMDLPDLNTGNRVVQDMVLDFLKECVNCGVDGFRFDAAKHIELPGDSGCGSDFWPYVLNGVRNYAENDLYIYGESLSGSGSGSYGGGGNDAWIDEFITYMALTDSKTSGDAREAVSNQNAGLLAVSGYYRGNSPRNYVLWAESHDTYEDGATAGYSNENIVKTWAIVGARANSTSLYLARPNNVLGKASSDTTWKSTAVAEVNKFKNHFDGTGEWLGYNQDNQYAYILRGNSGSAGIVIDNLNGAGTIEIEFNASAPQMADGTYKDEVSGNIFTVADGKIKGCVGTTGVAVIYNKTTESPRTITASTLYLRPASNWFQDGARFVAYFFSNSDDAWVSMKDLNNGYYSAKVPDTGGYTGVIFLCMVGTGSSFEWGAVWNQTSDLMPDEGKNCFTVKEGTGSYGGGTWSTYGDGTWSNDGDGGYYVVGTMNSWSLDPAYKMTQVDGTNEYTVETELMTNSMFKVVKSWDGITPATWYPDGVNNDYGYKTEDEQDVITADGIYKIRFLSDRSGGDNWHYGYITVEQTEYAVKVDNRGAQGTVTVSKERAAADEPITLTITPNEGYVLDTVTVTTARGGPVEVNNNTFTMPAENVTVKATFKRIDREPAFDAESLTLGGEISVNFYMDLSMLTYNEKVNSYMTFTVGTENKQVESRANFSSTNFSGGTWGFTCYVNAIQMADKIYPVFHYTPDGSSEEKTVSRDAYTVRTYAIKTQYTDDAELKDLAKKMIDYGHFVQIYLSELRNWTIGSDYAQIETYEYDPQATSPVYNETNYNYVETQISDHAIVRNFDQSVISEIKYSLVLDSKTTIRLYIKPADGYTGDITVSGAATTATKQKDGRYLVEITGIGADKLGVQYTVNITTTNATAEVKVSAMSYVYGMLTYDNASTEAKDAVCSLYYYWMAAQNYVRAHQS